MNRRETLLAVGVASTLGGLVLAYVPALRGLVDSPTTVPFLISVVALAAATLRARTWLTHDERDRDPTERERPTGVGVPGDGIDTTLARAAPIGGGGGRGGSDNRRIDFRQSLRDDAIATLVTFQGYTEEEARAAIDRGTWTDDRYAAEFFTTARGSGTSITDTVKGTLYGEGPFNQRANRAAREIERLGRGEDE